MAKTQRDTADEISPGYLQGDTGTRLRYAFTLPEDAALEATRQGVKARFPGVGTPTALALIGADKQLDRGPNESAASYANRLAQAFDAWAHAGSARAVLGQLLAFLSPVQLTVREVNSESAWDTLPIGAKPNDPPLHVYGSPNFNWDGTTVAWWRFWVILYAGSHWSKAPTLGSGRKLGDGRTLGSTMTRAEVDSVRAIVGKWKCKGHWCRWLIVSFDTSLFSPTGASTPDGTWGPWSRYDGSSGTQVAARSFSAIYLDGWPNQVVRGGSGSTIDTIGA